MKRIGILGGSYNPAHKGHRHVAEEAHRIMGLDEVWMWMSHSIFKDRANYASVEDRKHILGLYAKDRPWMKIQDMEKDFCGAATANSLTLLQAMYPSHRFIWIFGDDNFASFHTWDHASHKVDGIAVPDWEYMMHNFPIAVVHRPGSGYHKRAVKSTAARQFAHTQILNPRELGNNPNGWSFIKNRQVEVSSTQIKQALLAHHRKIRGLIPDVEHFIYDRGLYNTRDDFNTAAAPAPIPNTVPLQTFTLLATTANLVKSAMAGTFVPAEFIAHAATSWDKSNAKGDFGKSEDVPGEIADTLISLYWLAQLRCIGLKTLPGLGRETQNSVCRWCDTHYPGEDLKQRAKNILEELAELCVCEGMEKDRMVNLLTLVLEDPETIALTPACVKTLSRLKDYTELLGLNLQTVLDQKMDLNRTRTVDQSAARKASKFNGPN